MTQDITKFVKRSLPIMNAVDVESIWYALRMTPLGKYTSLELEEFIKTITDTYVFTQEISKQDKEHYHCVIACTKDEFDLREIIRSFLKTKFGLGKRGDANKQYNLSECIDVETSIIYLLKDGGVLFSGNFDVEKLKELSKKSYKKYEKEEFAIRLKEIKDRIKDNPNIKLPIIMEDIVNLKAIYRQPINLLYIYQLSLSLYLHNNPTLIKCHVENFLSRLY